jgi:hypothetical protein
MPFLVTPRAVRTSWQRDEGNEHRARLELDPWQVRLLEGVRPALLVIGAALAGDHAVLQLVSHQHVCGASRATTGRSWWVRVDSLLGVISRSHVGASSASDLNAAVVRSDLD